MKVFKPNYTPFTIEDEEGVRHYCIGNMTGDARDAYMESIRGAFTPIMENGQVVGMKPDIEKITSPNELLYCCVYPANADGKRTSKKLVDKGIINAFPVNVLDWALEEAAKLNGMGDKGKEAVKNSLSGQSEESGTESPSDSTAPSEKPSVV